MNNKKENVSGIILLVVVILLGVKILPGAPIYFRMFSGLAIGYTLTRAALGFAGGPNRAYRSGSTKLFRGLLSMFFMSAIVFVGFQVLKEESLVAPWVKPINMGLIAGSALFGFGMAFTSCCASGTLTDLATELPKALITLVFFGLGNFLGMPMGAKEWVNKSWIESSAERNGVYFPDLFKNTPFGGYLGAIVITGALALFFAYLARKYEARRKKENTYSQVADEVNQEKANLNLEEMSTYERLLGRPWTLREGAFVFTIIFGVLLAATNSGWGVSGPYGIWFGKLLKAFGMAPETIAKTAGGALENGQWTGNMAGIMGDFWASPIGVQNINIILGTLIALLTMGRFSDTFKAGLKISGKEALTFVVGGFLMGYAVRLSSGCNAGGLFTPIATLSLSGWIFLIFMTLGAVLGNKLRDKIL